MNHRRFLTALFAVLLFAVPAVGQTNVRDYMADGVKDAGPAIQRALDSMVRPPDEHYFPTSGSILEMPDGVYRVYAPIIIPPCGSIHIRGTGSPYAQSRVCVIEYYGHPDKGPLFQFAQPTQRIERHNGFKLSNILIWAMPPKGTRRTQTAMSYTCDPNFSQGMTFSRVGFYYWDVCLRVTTEEAVAEAEDTDEDVTYGTPSQMGFVRFYECEAHDNKQFIDARVGKVNMLRIRDSYISGNRPDAGDYVIDLQTPQSIVIEGGSLEGQPRVLRCINGSGITIDQCQWEGQTGKDPVMYFENCRGVDIGSQHYHRFPSDAPIWLELKGCEDYRLFPNVGRVVTDTPWNWRG